jgi:hypothetical protein
MLRIPLLALALCISCTAFAQLSKGEGESVSLPGKRFSCYLPKFFEIQEQPPGVVHKASGTFIIAVKVPSDRKVSVQEGLPHSFFEDPRYEIVSLREEQQPKGHSVDTRSYWMQYKIQGYDFERYTTLVRRGEEQFLIIGNYPVKLKDQVQKEVKQVMDSFTIR